MKTKSTLFFGMFVLSLALASCNSPSSASAQTNAPPSSQAAPSKTTKVAKIFFVAKEIPCACTVKSTADGWAFLQQALGNPAKVPVEKLFVEKNEDRIAPLKKQKPSFLLPAIYFVDDKNNVIDMVQGEVTVDQIAKLL